MNSSNQILNKKKPSKTKAFFICLIISSLLWLFHSLNIVYSYTFKVPVNFKNIPQNKKPLIQIPEKLSIDVKASGLKLLLLMLNQSEKELDIDFNNLKAVNKNQNYVLSSSQIDFNEVLKFDVLIKHINPDTLYFTEKIGYQKNVPIKVPLYLNCKEGFGYLTPRINPSFITIWGDTSIIKKIDSIYTTPLTLSNISKSINHTLKFIKPSENVYTSETEATIFIDVSKLIEQTISIPISNNFNKLNEKTAIFPSRVKVRFTSLQNNINNEDTLLFKATINSSNINLKNNKCKVFLSTLPGHVTIMSIEPKEVEILNIRNK